MEQTKRSHSDNVVVLAYRTIQDVFIDKSIVFLGLILLFTIICTAGMVAYILNKYTISSHSFIFTPNYLLNKVEERDRIDSLEKLEAIFKDKNIDKNFTPLMGDFIGKDENGLFVISAEDIHKTYKIQELTNDSYYDYAQSYKFIPNVVTTLKVPILVQKVNTIEARDSLLSDKKIILLNKGSLCRHLLIGKQSYNTYFIIGYHNISLEPIDDSKELKMKACYVTM